MSTPRRNRIEAIKKVQFIEAVQRCCPSIDTEDLPVHIPCLLEDHNDKTGSFYLQRHRWHCFGCNRGGDVLDLLQGIYGWDIHRALDHAEECLGIVTAVGGDAELHHLQQAAESEDKPQSPAAWIAAIDSIEVSFLNRVLPFLRCADPDVVAIALPRAEHVFEELDEAKSIAPRTDRGRRDKLRELSGWTNSSAKGIATDVKRATGKDRLDAAVQALYTNAS